MVWTRLAPYSNYNTEIDLQEIICLLQGFIRGEYLEPAHVLST